MAMVGDMQGQMNQQQDKFKKKVGLIWLHLSRLHACFRSGLKCI
jgi:hypothetical protein